MLTRADPAQLPRSGKPGRGFQRPPSSFFVIWEHGLLRDQSAGPMQAEQDAEVLGMVQGVQITLYGPTEGNCDCLFVGVAACFGLSMSVHAARDCLGSSGGT